MSLRTFLCAIAMGCTSPAFGGLATAQTVAGPRVVVASSATMPVRIHDAVVEGHGKVSFRVENRSSRTVVAHAVRAYALAPDGTVQAVGGICDAVPLRPGANAPRIVDLGAGIGKTSRITLLVVQAADVVGTGQRRVQRRHRLDSAEAELLAAVRAASAAPPVLTATSSHGGPEDGCSCFPLQTDVAPALCAPDAVGGFSCTPQQGFFASCAAREP
jgi:hypothetical protein